MDALMSLLELLNTLSPLAVIALLALVLLMQAKNHKTFESIRGNDLHELPTIAANIRTIAETLQRMEVGQSENFSYLKAKL